MASSSSQFSLHYNSLSPEPLPSTSCAKAELLSENLYSQSEVMVFFIYAWYLKWALTERRWMPSSALWSGNKENSRPSHYWRLFFLSLSLSPPLSLVHSFLFSLPFFLSQNRTPVITYSFSTCLPCEKKIASPRSSLSSWLKHGERSKLWS